ncbi:MAG: hypothetical protein U1B84_32055, partial [Variovorax sp.]|nr:hypothetical protein [Variovorax sp.]
MLPRPALSAVGLAVAALHVALLWLLATASRPHPTTPTRPTQPITVTFLESIAPTRPATPQVAPRVATTTASRPAPRQTRAPARDTPIEAPAVPAEAIAPSPVSPPPLRLNSEAIRRALRDEARQRSFADQATQDLRGPVPSAFDTPLAARVAGAAHGDCLRGQFKGSQMGL